MPIETSADNYTPSYQVLAVFKPEATTDFYNSPERATLQAIATGSEATRVRAAAVTPSTYVNLMGNGNLIKPSGPQEK